jgi:hypothetical protein
MAADKPRATVAIRQWLGLTTHADPFDLPPGMAVDQVNIRSSRIGEIVTRGGFKVVSFDAHNPTSETPAAPPAEEEEDNALLTDLVDFWKMDQASGNETGSHASIVLTDNNTCGSTTGKINNARTFNGTNESFSAADSATLSTGDVSFYVALWVKWTSTVGDQTIIGKWTESGNQREWRIRKNAFNGLDFFYSSNGTNSANVATGTGIITTGVWYFLEAWHSATANEVNIAYQGGSPTTLSYSSGVFDSTAVFEIGSKNAGGAEFLNGAADEVYYRKGSIPSTADRAALYNAGSGLTYPFT